MNNENDKININKDQVKNKQENENHKKNIPHHEMDETNSGGFFKTSVKDKIKNSDNYKDKNNDIKQIDEGFSDAEDVNLSMEIAKLEA